LPQQFCGYRAGRKSRGISTVCWRIEIGRGHGLL
jgi:hypothetical protein